MLGGGKNNVLTEAGFRAEPPAGKMMTLLEQVSGAENNGTTETVLKKAICRPGKRGKTKMMPVLEHFSGAAWESRCF